MVDKVVDKKGTRKEAEAYLKFLWSDEGAGDRRASTTSGRARQACCAKYAKDFPKVRPSRSTRSFGGWTKAQKEHFDDGAIYDQILAAKK